ncbi:MAG: DUF3450 domain-containing protein [Pseudomonadota bacterium]
MNISNSICNKLFAILLLTTALVLQPSQAADDALDQSRETVTSTNEQLKKKQGTIDKLDEETAEIVDEYKSVLRETETYQTYNQQLTDIVESQNSDLDSLQNQIVEIEVTAQRILPMMQRMIDTLEAFVAQDTPFLPDERNQRLARLNDTMKRADITVAEKYRKILEAYQIEIEYGKTLEAYDGELNQRRVSFLRVGRIGFYFRTPDKQQYAVWDRNESNWQVITDLEVTRSIDSGLKIARKQQSPELLTLIVNSAGVE